MKWVDGSVDDQAHQIQVLDQKEKMEEGEKKDQLISEGK